MTMPPGPKVLLHQGHEFLVRPCVEPGGRLVEQPDRAVAGEQPSDRRAAFLPGREIAERQMAETAKADLVERRLEVEPRLAEKAPPEFQIFRDRQRGLHGVEVAEIVTGSRDRGPFFAGAFQAQRSRFERQQPGESFATASISPIRWDR